MKKVISLCLSLMLIFTYTTTALGDLTSSANVTITRLYGSNRYATAVAIANALSIQANNGGKFPNIVLASGNNYPDALSGAPLAKLLKAPILLLDTTPGASATTLGYVKTHLAANGGLYILGGTGLFPAGYLQAIAAAINIAPGQIHQIGGSDREATSLMIGQLVVQLGGNPGHFADIVSANNYYDALTVASRDASGTPSPIILVSPTGITAAQKTFLDSITYLEAVGDITKQIGTSYPRALQNIVISGADEYTTNSQYNAQITGSPTIYIATGQDYPDALAGAVLAGNLSLMCPIYLVQSTSLPAVTASYLSQLAYYDHNAGSPVVTQSQQVVYPNIVVLGGTGAVSDAVVQQIKTIMQGPGAVQ
ncbi:MAG: cell wall-binding repeat-containing protein [Peptococcaceae bacterium]|nr:cell wall-binding repeat-containing protein [Peptococcaceae bacterium]